MRSFLAEKIRQRSWKASLPGTAIGGSQWYGGDIDQIHPLSGIVDLFNFRIVVSGAANGGERGGDPINKEQAETKTPPAGGKRDRPAAQRHSHLRAVFVFVFWLLLSPSSSGLSVFRLPINPAFFLNALLLFWIPIPAFCGHFHRLFSTVNSPRPRHVITHLDGLLRPCRDFPNQHYRSRYDRQPGMVSLQPLLVYTKFQQPPD